MNRHKIHAALPVLAILMWTQLCNLCFNIIRYIEVCVTTEIDIMICDEYEKMGYDVMWHDDIALFTVNWYASLCWLGIKDVQLEYCIKAKSTLREYIILSMPTKYVGNTALL